MNKKTKIYLVVLIWAAALLQLVINDSINREEKMVEQVMSLGVNNLTEARVKAYAYYGNQKLNEEGKGEMAKSIAGKLGITSGYEVTHSMTGDNEITSLTKEGEYGDTTVKIVTINNVDSYNQPIIENYIMVEIDLKGSAGGEANNYKEILSDLYEDLGMEANTNVYMCSQVKGVMTESEMQQEINTFLTEMDAKQVEQVNFDGVSMVYGYSGNIDTYVYQDEKRINVNIAFTYDEEQDITYIHRAVPFIDRSF